MSTLIQINNEKRKQLNKENKKIYEDMLVYLRSSFDKSEEETEEILMELLDHLLILQKEGRDAEELFGDDPKGYANELVGELPKALTKESMTMVLMGICYFLGVFIFTSGLLGTVLHYVFDLGDSARTFYLGSLPVLTIMSLVIVFVAFYGIFYYIRWSCFKQVSKIVEFTISAVLMGVLPFGAFIALYYFMPSFGPAVELKVYWLMLLGLVFYLLGVFIKKKA